MTRTVSSSLARDMLELESSLQERETDRYSRRSILRSEQMYGRGFQSPGGISMVERICARLDLQPDMTMLDVGSGLGGACFYMARTYGLNVLGLDVSPEMIAISNDRLAEVGGGRVAFHHANILDPQLPKTSVDLLWSRDTVVYVADKARVWRNSYDLIRSGGQVMVTDFCRSAKPLSKGAQEYYDACGYHLRDLDTYQRDLESAGFLDVQVEDVTPQFMACLADEQQALEHRRGEFLRSFSVADFNHLMSRWDYKTKLCREGDLVWGLLLARAG